jgi:hypothetical protein
MKNTYKIGLAGLFLGCFALTSFNSNAQNPSDLAAFLKASKEDASMLLKGYTGPVIKGASYAMTGGWYTTGKTHDKLGVDVGVSMTLAFTPTSDYYFTPKFANPTTTSFTNNTHPGLGAPTFVGPKDKTTITSTYTPPGSPVPQTVSINGPEGLDLKKNIGFSAVPAPMVQIGIGLIFNTDLKVRFVPKVKSGDSEVSMLGFGLMHSIKQYLPGHDILPFDLSVLIGYNSVKGTTNLKNNDTSNGQPTSTDGKITYKLNSWVGQAVISKKLSVLTGYLGVGYGSVATNVDVTGTFNVNATPGSFSVKDPASIEFHNKSAKLTAGLRLKLGPIYFVGDYTLQKYNALTVGLGVSIR